MFCACLKKLHIESKVLQNSGRDEQVSCMHICTLLLSCMSKSRLEGTSRPVQQPSLDSQHSARRSWPLLWHDVRLRFRPMGSLTRVCKLSSLIWEAFLKKRCLMHAVRWFDTQPAKPMPPTVKYSAQTSHTQKHCYKSACSHVCRCEHVLFTKLVNHMKLANL